RHTGGNYSPSQVPPAPPVPEAPPIPPPPSAIAMPPVELVPTPDEPIPAESSLLPAQSMPPPVQNRSQIMPPPPPQVLAHDPLPRGRGQGPHGARDGREPQSAHGAGGRISGRIPLDGALCQRVAAAQAQPTRTGGCVGTIA